MTEMFYAEKLNEQQQQYCKEIYHGVINRKDRIRSPKGMSHDEFDACIEAVKYDYPELFYINLRSFIYYNANDYYEYAPTYLYSEEEVTERQKVIRNKAEAISRNINKRKLTVYQKCGLIHNYLVTNCVYDYEAVDNPDRDRMAYSIEGVFLHGKAVCQGIAMAFQYLCSLVGVNCIVARGVALQPGCTTYERHAWNIIRVGNEAAHIDATWDMNLFDSNEGKEGIPYDYFFLSDLDAMRDHQYVDYPRCRSLKSNYFERSKTQFQTLEEMARYVTPQIKEHSESDSEEELRIYFRLVNRELCVDDITQCIVDCVRQVSDQGFSYICSPNDGQAVYTYKIKFSK